MSGHFNTPLEFYACDWIKTLWKQHYSQTPRNSFFCISNVYSNWASSGKRPFNPYISNSHLWDHQFSQASSSSSVYCFNFKICGSSNGQLFLVSGVSAYKSFHCRKYHTWLQGWGEWCDSDNDNENEKEKENDNNNDSKNDNDNDKDNETENENENENDNENDNENETENENENENENDNGDENENDNGNDNHNDYDNDNIKMNY